MTELLDLNQAQQIAAATTLDSSLPRTWFMLQKRTGWCMLPAPTGTHAGTEQIQCQLAKSKCGVSNKMQIQAAAATRLLNGLEE